MCVDVSKRPSAEQGLGAMTSNLKFKAFFQKTHFIGYFKEDVPSWKSYFPHALLLTHREGDSQTQATANCGSYWHVPKKNISAEKLGDRNTRKLQEHTGLLPIQRKKGDLQLKKKCSVLGVGLPGEGRGTNTGAKGDVRVTRRGEAPPFTSFQ